MPEYSNFERPPIEEKPQKPANLASISGFEWWRRTLEYKTGLGLTQDAKIQYEKDLAYKKSEKSCSQCEQYTNWIFRYLPTVRFMTEEIKKVDPEKAIGRNQVHCDFCPDWTKGGGFHPELGLLICHNRIKDKFVMEDVIAHELVHVYDDAKFKVDWANLKHHACSEIRASSLSGECRYGRQLKEGAISLFGDIKKGHQACVKRRAVLSVMANPVCKDEATAKKVVDEVWDSCFNDTRPFERIYR